MNGIGARLSQIHPAALALVILLGGFGLAMLYSAAGGHFRPWAAAQTWRFLPGILLMFAVALIPVAFWLRHAYLIYGGAVGLLLAVEVIGHMGMGAQRWVALGGVNLQPSELTKLAVILALARYFQRFPPLRHPGVLNLIPALLIAGIPAVLILKQPNLGTTTILLGVTAWIGFAAGVRFRYFAVVAALCLAAAPIAWHFLHDYQKQRVMTFMNPEADPLGAGYNIMQSMIAIGSGGFAGKGFLRGSQGQLDFLPEKQTDFIFTMLTEEFGLLGGLVVILGYTTLIFYALAVGKRSRHLFGTLIANGIAAILCLHFTINLAMVMGMIPVVGVPLPLFSYGGSILVTMLAGFGLLFNVWIHRDEKLPSTSF